MKKVVLALALLSLVFTGVKSWGAEWRFYGRTGSQGDAILYFYDMENVDKLANGNLKVWNKAVREKALEKRFMRKEKKILTDVAVKHGNGYVTEFNIVNPGMDEEATYKVLLYEETVNTSKMTSSLTFLKEINCGEKKTRTLSASIFDDDGKSSPYKAENLGKWDYVIPETNNESMLKMLCR